MREILLKYIPQLLNNIRDELLSSAILVIILGWTFPQIRVWIFIVWLPAFIVYSYLKIKTLNIPKKSVLKLLDEHLQEPENWEKRFEGTREYWVYNKDPLFKIENGNTLVKGFKEKWMKKYPDMNHNYSFEIHIKYANTIINTLIFVALDGVRYIVPLPDRKGLLYFYNKKSIKTKVSDIVGSYYSYENLDEFAKAHKISIKNSLNKGILR